MGDEPSLGATRDIQDLLTTVSIAIPDWRVADLHHIGFHVDPGSFGQWPAATSEHALILAIELLPWLMAADATGAVLIDCRGQTTPLGDPWQGFDQRTRNAPASTTDISIARTSLARLDAIAAERSCSRDEAAVVATAAMVTLGLNLFSGRWLRTADGVEHGTELLTASMVLASATTVEGRNPKPMTRQELAERLALQEGATPIVYDQRQVEQELLPGLRHRPVAVLIGSQSQNQWALLLDPTHHVESLRDAVQARAREAAATGEWAITPGWMNHELHRILEGIRPAARSLWSSTSSAATMKEAVERATATALKHAARPGRPAAIVITSEAVAQSALDGPNLG